MCGSKDIEWWKIKHILSARFTIFTSETKTKNNNKDANKNVGNISCKIFVENWCFHSENIPLNVGYFFHLLIICISELKCCEK